MRGGGWQPIFDAESKNAKIPNSYVQGGLVGGWGDGIQLLMLITKMLKSHIPMSRVGWWVGGCQ